MVSRADLVRVVANEAPGVGMVLMVADRRGGISVHCHNISSVHGEQELRTVRELIGQTLPECNDPVPPTGESRDPAVG